MNRVIYNGIICCIASIHTLDILKQSNVMLWFASMNQVATMLHIAAILLLIGLGLKQKFFSPFARRAAILFGLIGLSASLTLSWLSYYSLPLLPVDWLLVGMVGIALALTGLNLPASEAVPVHYSLNRQLDIPLVHRLLWKATSAYQWLGAHMKRAKAPLKPNIPKPA